MCGVRIIPVSADFTVRRFFATLAPGSKLSPPVLFAAERSTRNEISPRPWEAVREGLACANIHTAAVRSFGPPFRSPRNAASGPHSAARLRRFLRLWRLAIRRPVVLFRVMVPVGQILQVLFEVVFVYRDTWNTAIARPARAQTGRLR